MNLTEQELFERYGKKFPAGYVLFEEDAKLLVVDSETFESMVKANSGIAYRIIKKLAERIKNSNKQLEIMMFKDANRKVVYGLVHASDSGEKLPDDEGTLVKLTADNLASTTGVVITKVIEILDKLSTAELIVPVSNGYLVSEKKKLFKFLEYLAMKEQVGDFSADALKTIITEQRINAEKSESN